MAKSDNLIDFLKDIADAIREVSGETGTINAQNFSTAIRGLVGNINGGGTTNSIFPITLIVGDNGQYGKDVFNYLYDIVATHAAYVQCDLLENERVTVGNHIFTKVFKATETRIMLAPTPSGYLTAGLNSDGYLVMTKD